MDLVKTTNEAINDAISEGHNEILIGQQLCRLFFKNDDGQAFELTDTQSQLFMMILLKRSLRNQVISYTQWGKSNTVAMAVDLRSIVFSEDFTIIAGQQDKSDIIMSKAINHLFDHPALEAQIDPLSVPKLERLRHEKSRERVTWRDGGQIRALTASAQNRQRVKEVVTGQGARNVIADEASLIPDDLWAMIMRMLGGFKDSFLLKIGNPFYRNHFFQTWNSDKYAKLLVDYEQGLREGRLSLEYVEEMRALPFFDVLYECKFPAEDEIMFGGYRRLISDELLQNAFITEEEFQQMCTVEIKDENGKVINRVPEGEGRLGGDFAGGGNDRSAYVVRWPKVMKLLETNKIADTMQQVPIIENYMKVYGIKDTNTSLDAGGLEGISDRLHEKEHPVNSIMFGQSPPDIEEADGKNAKQRYKNIRAYMYYQMVRWLEDGGKIVEDNGFYEFLVINYKEDSEKKFQIQPKEELKKIMRQLNLTVTSPDVPDAAVLTFVDNREAVTEDDWSFG